MRSLFKIIVRYSLSAGLIVVVILVSNAAAVFCLGYSSMKDSRKNESSRMTMEKVGKEITVETAEDRDKEDNAREAADEDVNDGKASGDEQKYVISQEGLLTLQESPYLWAMAIAPNGEVVWDWRLPQEIPRVYTLQEVASFTRWYLEDYPVRVWRSGELLLVFASDPELESRHSLFMSLEFVKKVPFYLKVLLTVNIAVILLFILCFGWRFYRALQPICEGIEQLSKEQTVHLKEKGVTSALAGRLNHTSRVLQQQKEKLAQRDEARTEWISGVSHDIRTPLALIVGYTDRLKESVLLCSEEKEMVTTIQRQSLIIAQLIQDLNLTSKLVYHSQPIKKEVCVPAHLLRECVADLYNEGLNQNASIIVTVTDMAEKARISADIGLLSRALRNLIGNSIRHNPNGCTIELSLSSSAGKIFCRVSDSGPGIPEEVVNGIDQADSTVHIMGLRLVAQIVRAHGGVLVFRKRQSETYDAEIVLSCLTK